MDGVTSALAFASLAMQLADTCMRIYRFWDSVREAPAELAAIMGDLLLLSKLLKEISMIEDPSPAVTFTISSCEAQVNVLSEIVKQFEVNLQSTSRKVRLWTAFKASAKSTQLEKFRLSVSEAKQTLSIALLYHSISRPPPVVDGGRLIQSIPNNLGTEDPPPYSHVNSDQNEEGYTESWFRVEASGDLSTEQSLVPSITSPLKRDKTSQELSSKTQEAIVKESLYLAVQSLVDSDIIGKLVDRSFRNVTSFESISAAEYKGETYTIRSMPLEDSKPYCNPKPDDNEDEANPNNDHGGLEHIHQTSLRGVLFGTVWTRNTKIKLSPESNKAEGKVEITNSFTFYPSNWLARLGLSYGVEASFSSVDGDSGWRMNFRPVRAVPDTALIFDFAKSGNLSGIQTLLQRGDASVQDTNSKGWTALHYAAEGGHVELCDALIKEGARKDQLVYEGTSSTALSPITVFAESAHNLPAELKIKMLRLFMDCLDISEAGSDGWLVIHALIDEFQSEDASMSDISVNWVLRMTCKERFVSFGPRSIWDGLQHATRTFMVHSSAQQVLTKLLKLRMINMDKIRRTSRIKSLEYWLALMSSQRELIPLLIHASTILRIEGFDWVDDNITPRNYIGALPELYNVWAKQLPQSLHDIEKIVAREFEDFLERTGWLVESFVQALSPSPVIKNHRPTGKTSDKERLTCSECEDDYTVLGAGLISPTWIAFIECTKLNHKRTCDCLSYLNFIGDSEDTADLSDDDFCDAASTAASSVDEEFDRNNYLDDRPYDISTACQQYVESWKPCNVRLDSDIFHTAATLHYRVQGRQWLGRYEVDELLCGTCFLMREYYLSPAGAEKKPTPMPDSFGIYGGEKLAAAL